MKRFVLLCVAFLVTAGIANAQSVADSTATAEASATVINAQTTTSGAVSGSSSGVTLQAGAISNTASGGTGTSSAQNGNMAVQTGDVNVGGSSTNITFEAGKTPNIPPPAAFMPPVAGSTPQIFGPLAGTANEKGIDLTLYYANVCPSKAVRGYDSVSVLHKGASKKTEIVFTPHLNYAKAVKKQSPSFDDNPVIRSVIEVQEVEALFGKTGHYKCLGIMTISANNEKAGEAPLSTILSDASNFPLREMEGFEKIVILSSPEVISATKGVDNQGGGFGLGAGASRFFDPLLGTLGGSAGTSSGVTYPETKLSVTFLVLVPVSDKDPTGVYIDLSPRKPEPVAIAPKAEVVPVVVESKPAGQQEVVVVPKQEALPRKEPKKPVVKKPASTPKNSVVKGAPTVIKCVNCIINGTVTIPEEKAKPASAVVPKPVTSDIMSYVAPSPFQPEKKGSHNASPVIGNRAIGGA